MSYFDNQGRKKGRMKVLVIFVLCVLLLIGVGIIFLGKRDSASQEITVNVDPTQAVLVDVSGGLSDAALPEQQGQEAMTEAAQEGHQEEIAQSSQTGPDRIEPNVVLTEAGLGQNPSENADLQGQVSGQEHTTEQQGVDFAIEENLPVEEVPTAALSEALAVQQRVFVVDEEDISHYAGVRSVNGYTEIKFATGETFLPDGTRVMLGNAAQQGARGRFIVMTTYRSSLLSEQEGEALAEQRAVNIKRILLALGVPEKQIIGLKPQLASHEELLRPDIVDIRVETAVDYLDAQIMVLNTD